MSSSQPMQTPEPPEATPPRVRSRARATLHRLRKDRRGFASAEAALLALVLGGICIVAGAIVQRAALQAATSLNTELAGGK